MARRANLNAVLHISDEYKLTGYVDNIDHCLVRASRPPKFRACPECGCFGHVNAHTERKVYHTPVGGKPCFVILDVVRFRCPGCGKTYYDRYDDLVSDVSPHMTADVADAILLDIVDKMSIAAIARKEGPGESMCTKVLDSAILAAAYLPRVLCIDEFKANTDKGKMAVGVADGDVGRLVEVLERPRGDVLGEFFGGFTPKERARVEYFCCDMSGTFIAAQEKWFPGAKLCLDRFHVVKEVSQAFNKVRVRVADKKEVDAEGNELKAFKFTAKEKKTLKKARYDLRTKRWELEADDFAYATGLAERRDRLRGELVGISEEDLDEILPKPRAPKCAKVDALLEWDWELRAAYDLLQLFYAWSETGWRAAKRDGLEEWCRMAMDSGLAEFKTVARTFRRHREGILNGYKYDKTNATAEGLNNTIKLLKKNAYGYKTFSRMRRRCLFTLGYYRLVKLQANIRQVEAGGKRPGKHAPGDDDAALPTAK